MFVTESRLERVVRKIMGVTEEDDKLLDGYRLQVRELKDKIADLNKEAELTETKTKHYVKMNQEREGIEVEKKMVALQKEFNDKEMKMMKEYHEKVIELKTETLDKIESMTKKVMERLPNVNMEVKRRK